MAASPAEIEGLPVPLTDVSAVPANLPSGLPLVVTLNYEVCKSCKIFSGFPFVALLSVMEIVLDCISCLFVHCCLGWNTARV